VEVLNVRAVALASLGRLDEARTQLDRVLAESPDSAQALETLAFVAIQEDRYAEARRLAERAVTLDGSRPDAWNNLAVALYWLGERTEAIEAWGRCLDLVPDQPDALLGLGIVLAESGRAAEARDHLERFLAAADASRYADARRQATEILRELG
jgi:tetratricopeptide (TPR) repeat protein